MQVTIYLTRGKVEVQRMTESAVHDLLDQYRYGAERTMGVVLDDNAITHIQKKHVIRIDVDEED